ncbi:MAG: ASCH domain-containing protein [Thermoplasmata archaeon]|nr:MAG: ASCH domain-containing protein [Thermoplasmata archaeon]
MDHIVELRKDQITMLLSGSKTIEPKFMREKLPPYDCIHEDDTIYFKVKDGYAVAKANVTKVENYCNLTPDKVVELINDNKEELCPTEQLVEKAVKSKFGTFVWLNHLQEIRPFRIKHGSNGITNWTIVDDVNKIRTL